MSRPFESNPNPFESPGVDPTGRAGGGRLDIGLALSEGWDACWRQFGNWLAVSLVGFIVMMLSFMSILGWVVVLPVLGWGFVQFTLRARDDRGELGDLFAGFKEFGPAFWSMLVISLVLGVGNLVSQVPSSAAQALDGAASVIVGLLGVVAIFGWMFGVGARLAFAPYYAVDQRMNGAEALQAAWAATNDQKLQVALFIYDGATASAYRQISGTTPQAPSPY